jgi:hypothetical protein
MMIPCNSHPGWEVMDIWSCSASTVMPGIDLKMDQSCFRRAKNRWHSCDSYGRMACVVRSHMKRH